MQRAFISFLFSTLPIASLGCLIPLSVKAQVTPDGTTSTTVNQDGNNYTIEQGDRVGDNLFHSFNEFSVPTGGSAGFNNAADIANIFSRVTGSSISNIDGLLSASGTANLYLINPNGIIFGENASLNLGGSFFASTADSLLFEGDTEFSAADPSAPPLLEVSIPIGLSFRDNPADITNRGNLAVEQNFTFSGSNLDLQGQLQAGGDLTLQALDTVQIRDSTNNSFIAAANGELLIEGNQNVDIFALNHPNSGLFSGGDLVLRSANAVSGDAYYWSGGNFKIEQLDGNLGNLSSPKDPIIRSRGDVQFNNYIGNSLHILAGGSVTIPGSIIIADSDPSNFITEDVTLSDETLISIDGSVQPTLDIRAGVDLTELENTGLTGDGLFFSNVFDPLASVELPVINNSQVTSADIIIGDVSVISPNGVVLLTNQYQPNVSLASGIIEVGSIQTNDTNVFGEFSGNSGSITIDSRSNFTVTNLIDSSSATGDAGNIQILAGNAVSLTNEANINSNTAGSGKGGDINVQARSFSLTNGGSINSDTTGQGNGGNVTISASDFVEVSGISFAGETSQLGTFVNPSDNFVADTSTVTGMGGNVLIKTGRLTIENGAQVQAGTFGEGKGGSLIVNSSELIEVIGTDGDQQPSGLFTATFGFGSSDAGDLTINTGKLVVRDGGQISASTFSVDDGRGGNLSVTASESVEVIGTSENGEFSSSILAETGRILNIVNTDPEANADGRSLSIETGTLSVLDGAVISTQTLGAGNSGNLVVSTTESVQLTDSILRSRTQGSGNAGNINITTGQLNIQGDEAEISASTVEGSGQGGNLTVIASDSIKLSKGSLGSVSILGGDSGNLSIETNKLTVDNGASISNGLVGSGSSGNININASDSVQVTGGTFVSGSDTNDLIDDVIDTNVFDPNEEIFFASRITTESASLPKNPAGNLSIKTNQLTVNDGAEITTRTVGDNPGGTLNIQASEFVEVSGFATADDFSNLSAQTTSNGNAGNIVVETPKLIVRDSAQVSADTSGTGNAGSLSIFADNSVKLTENGGLLIQAIEGSTAGNLNLETNKLTIADNGFISVSSLEGQAGNLNITANSLTQNQGQITAETGISQGDIGGNINLEISDTWRIENESIVSATAFGNAEGGNININQDAFEPEFLLFAFPPTSAKGSDIIANAENANGGRIEINAAGIFGIDFREEQTSLNDFTVSSQFGAPGETIINRTVDDPTSGLINLPASVGDATDQISQNPCQQGIGSQFIVTGKGGVPSNPTEVLSNNEIQVGLIEIIPKPRSENQETEEYQDKEPINNVSTKATPAMGWVFDNEGKVTLTAYQTGDKETERYSQQVSNICSAASMQNR